MSVGAGCGDSSSSGGGGSGGGNNGGSNTGGTPSVGGGGTGGGSGATTCASYCATVMANCSGANSQYASEAACNAECAAFAPGDPGDTSMDTLECRAYHAGVAGMMDAQIHCIHAGPLGGGAEAMNGCGTDRCTAFCDVADQICAGVDGYPFTSTDDCKTQCGGYTDDVDFTTNETSGDTLACRMYHLSVAAQGGTEAMTHCPHVAGSMCTN